MRRIASRPHVVAVVVGAVLLTADLVACGGGSPLPPGVAAASGSAPSIAGPTLDDASLPDPDGMVLVVNFWNPYCAPCRVEAPVLESVSKRYADRGVLVVGVHYTGEQWPKSVDDARSFVRAAHLSYPSIPDDGAKLATAFGIRGIPSTVIVDAGGRMRFRFLGPVERPVLDHLLDEVLEERATP